MFDVRYTSPVDADDALAGSDRIEAHSAVGAGMEVASIAGVQYGDTLLTGSLAAQAIQISLQDPSDLTGATHEFDYLINSINERYHLGYDAYNLFYEAMADGQVSYDAASGAFSNRVSWYIDADHHMVVGDNGLPYRFATQREIDAIATGSADAQTQERIDRARAAGATAVCETYLYIGNLPNFYTGGDVALYDFYIAVETDLDSHGQTVYLSIPADAVPALRTDITLHADGGTTMSIDGADALNPLRLVFEVAPRPEVREAIERARSGEATRSEIEAELGAAGYEDATGNLAVTALSVEGSDDGARAKTVVAGTAASDNSAYVLARNQPLYTVAPGVQLPAGSLPAPSDLAPLTRAPRAGETLYYMTTAYRANFSGSDGTAAAEAFDAVHPYQVAEEEHPSWHVGDDGRYELAKGTPASSSSSAAVTTAKATNATGTASYSQSLTGLQANGRLVLSAALGNNGSYRFEEEQQEPEPGDPGTEDPDPNPEEPGKPDPEDPSDPSTPAGPEQGTGGNSGSDSPSAGTSAAGKDTANAGQSASSSSEALAGTGDPNGPAFAAVLGIAGIAACAAGIALINRRK